MNPEARATQRDREMNRHYREGAPGPPDGDRYRPPSGPSARSNNHRTPSNGYQSYQPPHHQDGNHHRSDYARDRNYTYDISRGRTYDQEHGFAPGVDRNRYIPPPPANPPPPPPPPPSGPPPSTLEGGDSYRPKVSFTVPKASFDFRAKAPGAVQAELDRQSAAGPASQGYGDQASRDSRYARRANGRDANPRGQEKKRRERERRSRPNFHDTYRPGPPLQPFRRPKPVFVPAERELLSGAHADAPAESVFDETAEATYRDISDISDSDVGEAAMDISDGSGSDSDARSDSDNEEPRHKRARKGVESASGADVPKWSNPDPYTACPPEAGQQSKKKDVVQLIRKARVQAKEVKSSLPEQAKDFIALDFDSSDDESGDKPAISDMSIATVNNVSKALAAQFGLPLGFGNLKSSAPYPAELQVEPPTPAITRANPADGLFPRQPSPDRNDALGSRKRFHNDQIKAPPSQKPRKQRDLDGSMVSEWAPRPGIDRAPWYKPAEWVSTPINLLHKEIVDFYNYVRPREYEKEIRENLVKTFARWVRNSFRDAEVYPFGSFASELYLPTADMDLAFMSDSFRQNGKPKYDKKTILYRVKAQLLARNMALDNDVECITKAKVPIVKYTDSYTNLKVDVSFENNSGIVAINTFKKWKRDYPSMPILVTLIKQFLAMRGLNEPVNGGIGGFSVICLVVSLLQIDPVLQTKSQDPEQTLGEVLMRFFEFYGKIFDYKNIALCLNPPKYMKKDDVKGFPYRNYDRLSIIDPNNPANDIAGGSSNFEVIRSKFAEAHEVLASRMKLLFENPPQGDAKREQSILTEIMGGNYSSFETQRDHMRELSQRIKSNRNY